MEQELKMRSLWGDAMRRLLRNRLSKTQNNAEFLMSINVDQR